MKGRRQIAVRTMLAVLVCLLAVLQVRLWVSEDGFGEVSRLRHDVDEQRAQNKRLEERNRRLDAEVDDLKRGFSALEERARSDLGLIAPEETFYVIGETGDPDIAGDDQR